MISLLDVRHLLETPGLGHGLFGQKVSPSFKPRAFTEIHYEATAAENVINNSSIARECRVT